MVQSFGKQDRYGQACTKDIFYFLFEADSKKRELLITMYLTNTSLDVKVKGSPKESNE